MNGGRHFEEANRILKLRKLQGELGLEQMQEYS